jgi:preprotein translocase subunit SecF
MLAPFDGENANDAEAQLAALVAQQALIEKAIESTELRLRRTTDKDGVDSIADAIGRDDVYQGTVKGISDKVSKELIKKFGAAEVSRVDFVDATVTQELKTDGVIAPVLSLVFILIYVAIRFDIFFAPGAVIALLHDPVGALAVYVIGRMEFDLPSSSSAASTPASSPPEAGAVALGYSVIVCVFVHRELSRASTTRSPKAPSSSAA